MDRDQGIVLVTQVLFVCGPGSAIPKHMQICQRLILKLKHIFSNLNRSGDLWRIRSNQAIGSYTAAAAVSTINFDFC